VVHLVNARGAQRADFTVVGVVGDTRNISMSEELPTVYYSSSWRLWPSMDVAVRTAAGPESVLSAVRDRIRALDPQLPIATVQTMEAAMASNVSQPRFNAVLLIAFAGIALLVAAVGIYGVLAYSMRQRRKEIGVRMALGARIADVLESVMASGMRLVLAGIALGAAASFFLAKALASQLYGVSAADPVTFAAAVAVLAVVALAACFVPAWRATHVEPLAALRDE
jgi:putative ABC transport system permease protein